MVELRVEVENLTMDYEHTLLKLPCSLLEHISKDCEYVIVSAQSTDYGDIQVGVDDVWQLNTALHEINDENPDMTTALMAMVLNAIGGDLSDKETVRRLCENDFFFEDISNIDWIMNDEEICGCYLATILGIPFDDGIPKNVFEKLCDDSVVDYIAWADVWRQYTFKGFRLITGVDKDGDGIRYLLKW